MNSTVCIIGSHTRTRRDFDFNRTDCDIWVFNEAISNHTFPRADVVFQMHIPTIWRNPQNRNDPGHYDWLKTQTETTVYMQDVYPDIPVSKKYPLDGVLDMLNGDPDHFLNSSVSQAIALACYLGIYKRIEVFGVAMETNTEYQWQREGVAFWKGFAMGRGIEFHFADPTFRCPLYGYDSEVVLPNDVFPARIAELLPKISEISEKYHDAVVALQKAANAFEAGDNEKEHILPYVRKVVEIGQVLGALDGARQENERYQAKAQAMLETTGNFAFGRQEFESSAARMQNKVKEIEVQFSALGGQLGLLHNQVANAAKGSPKRQRLMDQYQQAMNNYFKCNNQGAVFYGAMKENFSMMARLDKGIRAAGGVKSEQVILEAMQNEAVQNA